MKLGSENLKEVRRLYYEKDFSMREVAKHFDISIDAVVYSMRKNNLPRRDFIETNRITFANKPMSFSIPLSLTTEQKELVTIGTMLYWAEGYKSGFANGIDFVNSNVAMIKFFLKFLREIYAIDEERLRVQLYCYSDQNVRGLISYWSEATAIPASQFIKPYVRSDFKKDGRKMEYGLVHIRYGDKKLLSEIKNLIESYKSQYNIGF